MIEDRWVTFLVAAATGLKSYDYPPRFFRSRLNAQTPAETSRLRNRYGIALTSSISNGQHRFRFDSFQQLHPFHVRRSNVRHEPRDFTNVNFSCIYGCDLGLTSWDCGYDSGSKNGIIVRFTN